MEPIPLPLPLVLSCAGPQVRGDALLEDLRPCAAAGAGALAAVLPPEPLDPAAEAARLSLVREAAGGRALTAGVLGPTEEAIPPYGETPFEDLVALYARRAEALKEADLILVEEVQAMAQARAALLGVRQAGLRQPVLVVCRCDEEGRTPTGGDVLACGIVMQGMGAAAFGLHCSDPDALEEQLSRLHQYLDLPLIAVPEEGDFTGRVPTWAAAGARVFPCGGHAGETAALVRALEGVDFSAFPPVERDPDVIPCASEKEARFITPDVDVGETIECTPDLMEDIVTAEEESPVGALRIAILEQDDVDLFAQEQYAIRDALCLWSDVPELMEAALRVYQGRAFYDGTADLEPEVLERLRQTYGLILL